MLYLALSSRRQEEEGSRPICTKEAGASTCDLGLGGNSPAMRRSLN